ncbi:hypothetical protein HDU76_007017, partial [Blyttiomyces sp. JEL0837]
MNSTTSTSASLLPPPPPPTSSTAAAAAAPALIPPAVESASSTYYHQRSSSASPSASARPSDRAVKLDVQNHLDHSILKHRRSTSANMMATSLNTMTTSKSQRLSDPIPLSSTNQFQPRSRTHSHSTTTLSKHSRQYSHPSQSTNPPTPNISTPRGSRSRTPLSSSTPNLRTNAKPLFRFGSISPSIASPLASPRIPNSKHIRHPSGGSSKHQQQQQQYKPSVTSNLVPVPLVKVAKALLAKLEYMWNEVAGVDPNTNSGSLGLSMFSQLGASSSCAVGQEGVGNAGVKVVPEESSGSTFQEYGQYFFLGQPAEDAARSPSPGDELSDPTRVINDQAMKPIVDSLERLLDEEISRRQIVLDEIQDHQ